MNFNQKVILITGASAGIGSELAKQLSKEAKTIILVARRREALEALKAELLTTNNSLNVLLFAKDISIVDNQQEIKDELQKQEIVIDILINNAGIGDEALFHQSDVSRLQTIIDLNITAVVNFTHLFIQDFIASPHGKGIVFVGSGAGIAWMPGSAVYSASKHFVTAMAMNLHSELKPLGIEIKLIAPGPVDSEFDKHAGIEKGMKGGPSQKTRISAEECAIDSVRLLKTKNVLIVPGKKIRRLMNFYLWLPWFLRKQIVESDGKKIIDLKILQ